MKTFISFLRGINVSGRNRISMPDLKRLYESMGLVDGVTYIQSGNVVFDTEENDQAKIIKLIEEGLTRSFGGDVRVILRGKESLNKILESNPFINQKKADPDKLYVTFMDYEPIESRLKQIENSFGVLREVKEGISPPPVPRTSSTASGVETADGGLIPPRLGAGEIINIRSQPIQEDEFIIDGKEIYLFCPNGYGKTKFSNTYFEKKLKITATTRNWKTVNALYEIAERRRL